MSNLIINSYRFSAAPPAPGCSTPGVTLTGSPGGFNTTLQLGWEFVPTRNLSVCKLRVNANYNGDITVYLWAVTGSSKLGSVTVTGIANAWVEGELPSAVGLTSAAHYIVSARQSGGGVWACHSPASGAVSFDGAVSHVNGRFVSGAAFPTNVGGGIYAGGIADIVFS